MRLPVLMLLITAVPAIAQDSPMTGAFGNTIVSTAPDGTVTRTWIDADGSYRSQTGGGVASGSWTVRHGLLCYAQTDPAPAAPLCTLGPGKHVGSRWSLMQPSGMSVKVQIVAGRVGMPAR